MMRSPHLTRRKRVGCFFAVVILAAEPVEFRGNYGKKRIDSRLAL